MICHQRLLNNNYNKNRVIDFMEREQMIKFVIVGDSGVGKSNILSRYVSNEFGKCESTMGC
jgi:GTPase SAR1 family protein